MSVDVKTPTKTQFEHPQFHCGDRKQTESMATVTLEVHEDTDVINIASTGQGDSGANDNVFDTNTSASQEKHDDNQNFSQRPFYRMESAPAGKAMRKRRYTYTERGLMEYRHERFASQSQNKQRGRFGRFGYKPGATPEKIVLPTKFLLGGNINDPLNLNSMCDEEVNKALNQLTPQSSPLPTPAHRQQVQVLIPPNITDPLNLNSGEDVDMNLISPKSGGKKKRHHVHKHKKKRSFDGGRPDDLPLSLGEDNVAGTNGASGDILAPVHVDITPDSESSTMAITPVDSSNLSSTVVESSSEASGQNIANKLKKIVDKIVSPVIPQVSPKSRRKKRTSSECKSDGGPAPKTLLLSREDSDRSDKTSPPKPKFRKQGSNQTPSVPHHINQRPSNSSKPQRKFIYGNYNRYYGYRNPDFKDGRIKGFRLEWFEGRDVLDIGCNVGHVTLTIAKDFRPRKVIGIDIDHHLIKCAKNNIRHYLSTDGSDRFPASMALCYGPIAAGPVPTSRDFPSFPNNIVFLQGNYVLETDELLELQREEYDVIMALSLTKWIHLNFGDDGMKRVFKRIYRQLRPGGKLILEPQSWASYKKKKSLSETILKNYQTLRMRPEQFTEYLLSREVGFSTCQVIEAPFNKAKGFRRPIQVYTKPDTCYATPYPEARSTCATPIFRAIGDSKPSTPRFLLGSSAAGTPSSMWDDADSHPTSPCARKDTEEETPADTPKGQMTPSRPIEEVKCYSAPSLLEQSPFKLKSDKDNTDTGVEMREMEGLETNTCKDETMSASLDTVEKTHEQIEHKTMESESENSNLQAVGGLKGEVLCQKLHILEKVAEEKEGSTLQEKD